MSNWTQLTRGGGYDFDTKQLFGEFVFVDDVVRPLAGLLRFVRHTSTDWAVAIHSVCVARTIELVTGSATEAAAGLLHDLHESITGDIPTPVARAVGYNMIKVVQADIQFALENKLGIPDEMRPANTKTWKIADCAALLVEKKLLHCPGPRDWGVPEPQGGWMEGMLRVMEDAFANEDHKDGGLEAFKEEYHRLIVCGGR